eukprot:365241-Chlamydomonas_euryale.AAC.11
MRRSRAEDVYYNAGEDMLKTCCSNVAGGKRGGREILDGGNEACVEGRRYWTDGSEVCVEDGE